MQLTNLWGTTNQNTKSYIIDNQIYTI